MQFQNSQLCMHNLRAETFEGINFYVSKKTRNIWQKLSRFGDFCGKNFREFKIREILAAPKKKKAPNVIVVGEINHYFWKLPFFYDFFWFYEFSINFRVSCFKKYPWFRVEKLSRFDDLEFPKAETFAKNDWS